MVPTLQGSKTCSMRPLQGRNAVLFPFPVALPPAIEFVAFGVIALLRSALEFGHFVFGRVAAY